MVVIVLMALGVLVAEDSPQFAMEEAEKAE
jgi:hypothetical protein